MGLPPLPCEPVSGKHFENCVTPVPNDFHAHFDLPTLADMGFTGILDVHNSLHGGEEDGMQIYNNYLKDVS